MVSSSLNIHSHKIKASTALVCFKEVVPGGKKSWFEKEALQVKSFEDDLRSLTNLPSQPIELSLVSSRLSI